MVAGEIDMAARDELFAVPYDALAVDGGRTGTVELSGTTFLDCCGIGILLAARHCAVRQRTNFMVTRRHRHGRPSHAVGGVWAPLVGRGTQPSAV